MNFSLISRLINSRIALIALIAALAFAAAMAGAGMDGSPVYGQTTVDYDNDDDGLIDITTLAQLNVIRHNLNGRGDSGNSDYAAAFPNRVTTAAGRMGCPGTNGCVGYELRADLDFDTDGDGISWSGTGASATGDSGDTYYNSDNGFVPIGTATAPYATTFKGNGHVIKNLFIKFDSVGSSARNNVGLFGEISTAARIESVHLVKPYVKGASQVGALAGVNRGEITSSFSSGGETLSAANGGGLIGQSFGTVHASYSTTLAAANNGPVGGLIGVMDSAATTTASFAAGEVTVASGTSRGGFIGTVAGTIENSYWDTNVTGLADDSDTNMPEGKTTAELQTPAGYTGIYADWNVSVDGTAGGDDPWDFGQAGEYPALKYGGMDPEEQRPGDYDRDGDGLIEITTLAQLNAIRWDLDGQGDRDSTGAVNWASYTQAFVDAAAGMGCAAACSGYELAAHLDFDTDGDGSTYSGTGAGATSDSGDAYHNGGSGWSPIGASATDNWSATFRGNGYTISNLFIKRTGTNNVGLFSDPAPSGRIETVGVIDAFVHGGNNSGVIAGFNRGKIVASWSTGHVRGSQASGGLAGSHFGDGGSAEIIAGYSNADVAGTHASNSRAGGLVGNMSVISGSASVTASYSTGTVTAAGGPSGGLIGFISSASVANSYWDTTASGVSSGGGGTGQTTANLQTPTGYAGIYENWNVNVDGSGGADDPWHFGTDSQYPVLKYGGMDPIIQRGDYDLDDDGLIDVTNFAQLDAIRWDLNGDGAQNTETAANWAKYKKAFLNPAASLGCPDTDDAGTEPGPCLGYELLNDLDFDTDGDGSTRSGTGSAVIGDPDDAYYNGGAGWLPIGTAAAPFNAKFNGNGNIVRNMFIRRTASGANTHIGLFGANGAASRIEYLGVMDAYIRAQSNVGGIVGRNYGIIAASFSTGEIVGLEYLGGLTGLAWGSSGNVGEIIASYSHANVTRLTGTLNRGGGLVGQLSTAGSVTASYSTGTVSSHSTANAGGIIGRMSTGAGTTLENSYWDTTTSGATSGGSNVPNTAGKTTVELQGPTGYTGIYADWNVDVDGDGVADDPWHFGTDSQYPVLKLGGMDTYDQHGDYDTDDDGLIEINNLARLNAVRWDLDGDAVQGSASDDDWKKYNAAFLNAAASLGCPDTADADMDPGPCLGYELVADLDFDTDGDGSTYAGSGANAVGDFDDAYYNGGDGWNPLGTYSAIFKGNGYVVSNLFVKRTGTNHAGLFGSTVGGARIESIGVEDAYVAGNLYVGVLAGENRGTIAASWTSGAVRGAIYVGGLTGYNVKFNPADVGDVIASYSRASAYSTTDAGDDAFAAGLVGSAEGNAGANRRPRIIASYSTGAATAGPSVGEINGLADIGTATVTNSYWDTTTSGVTTSDGGTGKTTAELFAPTDYAGIYANWNVDVDGDGSPDDPWDFRGEHAYPVLKYGGMDPEDQRFGDYDVDGDGLIEINSLARLNAVRWDLNGNAVQDSTSAANWQKYNDAFNDRIADSATRMGCPSGACAGYELTTDLDFDTDGDGATYTGTGATATGDDGDAYYNGGAGWMPIGDDSGNNFTATFRGNGLTISNLFIKRATTNDVGLFGGTSGSARIETIGVENAYVYAQNWVGAVIGTNFGVIIASWSDGYVLGRSHVGGLVGLNSQTSSRPNSKGHILACYSRADARAVPTNNQARVGGLAGSSTPQSSVTRTTASYSTGAVTSTATGSVAITRIGGLVGEIGSNVSYSYSYWDTLTSGIADDADSNFPEGKTTDELQTPTGYAGIYANWNIDLNGDGSPDDPWDFGDVGAYPALKYGGMNPDRQRRGDFDQDADGLIEIKTLAQLNAVRWDLNGDGLQGSSNIASWNAYNAAFPNADPGMGCPDTDDPGTAPGPCLGYELLNHLDFDTNGNGYTYTGTGASAVGDTGDAYNNNGAGWHPIGSTPVRFDATFNGNGYVIFNMFIKRTGTDFVGLFGGVDGDARIEALGMRNVHVHARDYAGALVGINFGTVAACWSDGAVRARISAGGLVGYHQSNGAADVGAIIASYSHASVRTDPHTGTDANAGGLTGVSQALLSPASISITASYSTGAVSSSKSGRIGGLNGFTARQSGGATYRDNYWDTTTSGRSGSNGGTGQTTAQLQTPTGYTGIYKNWNVDVDGDGVPDDPWHFGSSHNYPALKYAGQDPYLQYGGDFDTDDDGLIEINNLARLNAVRWDTDGDAVQDSASDADWKKHAAVFPYALDSLGCPDTADADMDPGPCLGYELAADLDFDTDGDGATYTGTGATAAGDPDDAYYNGGAGFEPFGSYSATFKGNGYVLSNLFIKKTSTNNVGLFSSTASTTRIESMGVKDGYVHGNRFVGILVGYNDSGAITSSWTSGEAVASRYVGGLVGYNDQLGDVIASYSHAAVRATHPTNVGFAAGLVGLSSEDQRATIVASYSTGTVAAANPDIAGLLNIVSGTDVFDSYWDVTASGVTASDGGTGLTTVQLETPTGYTGVFANWNVDVDGDGNPDDPWDFRGAGAYPVLKFGGMDPEDQRFGDYDLDGDGLIDITNLAQLNAVRWDLDGDAVRDSTSAADWQKYNAAFPDRITDSANLMGCASGTCRGYGLAANLDFDTDGDGSTYTGTGASATSDSGDAYHNGGEGWEPIGDDSGNRFNTTFKGNGFTISNLFIKRETTNDVGLFGGIDGGARVESLGVENAYVNANDYVGILAGTNYGVVSASWSDGAVLADRFAGGLVGYTISTDSSHQGAITASYSRASVRAVPSGGSHAYAGGLTGAAESGAEITASYSTGTVTSTVAGSIGGLNGFTIGSPTFAASYWDTLTSGITSTGNGVGKTTSELQTPGGYTGIYANWNVNVDGAGGADDPWDFGGIGAYPVLKYGGMDPDYQRRGDFDQDGDGLIEIKTLAHLNAMRWDLDGDALRGSTSVSNWALYNAAFKDADPSLGCIDTADADTDPGPCAGYELDNDLDFDTNGNGYTYTGTGAGATSDSGDAYHNGGAGWAPIGIFASTFKGNGYVISNLFIKRTSANDAGLFSFISNAARVETVGVRDAYVYGNSNVGVVAGINEGKIVASWSTGNVRGTRRAGGLAGRTRSSGVSAEIIAGYSHAEVVATVGNNARSGGLTGEMIVNSPPSPMVTASYSTGAVPGTATELGGLVGFVSGGGTAVNSYWDTTTSRANSYRGSGQTTAALQAPTGYTGIYANWNIDLDGDGVADDPWHFGKEGAYPVLKYGGMDPEDQRHGDFDQDGDGLIDISSLAQLDAVRYDLNGNATQDTASADDWKKYAAAFPGFAGATTLMGCPAGTCAGYELTTNLDFDTDGDGSTYTGTGNDAVADNGDAYYNGGAGWMPIGVQFASTFKGNGHVVSNLFVKRPTTNFVGLFGALSSTARVESVGVEDVYVYGMRSVGGLVGSSQGTISASYSTGHVRGAESVGGLLGFNDLVLFVSAGHVNASYTHASVASADGTTQYIGGFVGYASAGSTVNASYSTGTVESSHANSGGFVGAGSFIGTNPASITNSYWNTTTSGRTSSVQGTPKTTAELQAPTGYDGIYAGWNIDADGTAGGDDPWDFGGSTDYPVLKYGGMSHYTQRGDYDTDNDRLIEITTLDQLNAIRWDLNGNAVRDSASAADWKKHSAAFHNAIAGFGCPGACRGYELADNLTFGGDAKYSNWTPVGDPTTAFGATFEGNGYVISDLKINADGGALGLFGATASGSTITRVGLPRAFVKATSANDSTLVGALIGSHGGTLRESYATGGVAQSGAGTGGDYGGLIGTARSGSGAYSSWADVAVTAVAEDADAGGFAGSALSGSTIRAAHAGGDVAASGENAFAGGFAGMATGIAGAAYATGVPTAAGTGGTAGGFHARGASPTFTAVYWDTTATMSSIADDADSDAPEGVTTANLQSPTDYTGIYADWNNGTLGDVDGRGGADDPWNFGTATQYPALKFGVQDPYVQRGDYDSDNDGLIEITTLDRLNAIRWDMDGDGAQGATTTAADWRRYNLAFLNADAGMGCPAACAGYELEADLDFDANGDGAVDSDDPYPNWLPLGLTATGADAYTASFAGNGMTIANLTINSGRDNVGLFNSMTMSPTETVTGVGLPDASVTSTGRYAGTLAGRVNIFAANRGTVRYSWATGSVTHTGTGANSAAGGLIGRLAGNVEASWADVDVSSTVPSANVGGLIGESFSFEITASYAAGDVSAAGASAEAGGLTGRATGGTITASYSTGAVTSTGFAGVADGFAGTLAVNTIITDTYWDTTTSGVPDDIDSFFPEGITTANLQTPTGYDGIYANWNVDVDDTTGADDPWDFGASNQYPILDVGDMDTAIQPRAAERTPVITAPVQIEIPCAWVAHPSALNRCP